ncbi:MAG: radical SAM protein [Deltaproteobacteria bacterium]|nr:radical SAM protein [bacterium]MCB9477727.1 radical SAM protein [Deltaproteobacteria bacterium]MCB9478858.1 radical SAM protein [Deltaproteobacteria bacterium]MCB9488980.1 radical SAM protein [Deltaproteobacteria bacterium]
MNEGRVTRGQIKYFSRTVEPGLRGQVRRITQLRYRTPTEVAGAVTRKALRRNDKFRLLPFPQAVHIEITNQCNLACVMCPYPVMEREKGMMDEALFRRIVGELSDHRLLLENVAIMGLGEPMLNPRLEDFIVIAHEARIPNVYLSTNGTALTEKRARRLIEDGALGRIIISLDGASKETYESIRIGANFERVMENAERMIRLKKELGRLRPHVSLQILAMPQTESELDAFCERWAPLLGETDEILIKEVDTFGGQVDDIRLDEFKSAKPRIACRQLWKDMSISWDGRVTVCCKDVFYKLEVDRVAAEGDGPGLKDIWRSKTWQAYRRLHEGGHWNRMKPCDVCEEWAV